MRRMESGDVVTVEGLEDEDFVSGIEQPLRRRGVRPCSGGDEDFGFRVVGQP